MPRKVRCKRLIKTLDHACANLEQIERSIAHAKQMHSFLIGAIESEISGTLDDQQRKHLLELLTFWSLGPLIAKQAKIRVAAWRDLLILALRRILAERGVSTSLSEDAPTEFHQPFARVLKAAWLSLPKEAKARGSGPSALVARARTHSKRKGVPRDLVLNYVAAHGREIIAIQDAAPMRSSEAVRHLRNQLASGEVQRGNPTAEDLAKYGGIGLPGTKNS
ncbi:hypothetical protein [Hyphomicrobium sp. DY-1]|uniref:hypothetical protein n=1 Tax=Hyphomicrobium sp. DY-1 TaxID=3075650 RepID=UPI0039C38429